ncbi:MAG TPA: efflux RND transporter periplasmic adaptor subunit [Thermoanaerobaculia bacterium]|nr:efflux RND transporter periplasmic adaptor subunit [Thermoanaerobaculia bacterium]
MPSHQPFPASPAAAAPPPAAQGRGPGAAAVPVCALWIVLIALLPRPAVAQGGQGPAPVRYTEALRQQVAGQLQLTGTVEAVDSSVVAAEVAGLVAAFPAREGTWVRAGEPLLRLETQPIALRLEVARGELSEAQARLEQAELRLARQRELQQSGVVSTQTLDDAIYEHQAWQGRAQRLTAEVAALERDLGRATVRAPFAGVVVAEHTQKGEWLAVGDPVVDLISLQTLEVRVEVPERHYAEVRVGGRARVVFDSLNGLALAGEVHAVVPRADARARTFPVKVRFGDREGRVGAGMLARVALPFASASAVLVPKDAVVSQGPERFVWVIRDGGAVERVDVQPGRATGAWVVVAGGVAAGDRVVTRGNERLQPGMKVAGQPQEYPAP